MKFSEDNVEIILPGSNYPEHTKRFIGIMLRIISKAHVNDAYQLHALSLLTTGKSFMELLSKQTDGVEHMVDAIRTLSDGNVRVRTSGSDMTDLTIDDLLGD